MLKKSLAIFLLAAFLLLAACGTEASAPQSGSSAAASGTAATNDSDHTVITINGTKAQVRGGGARDEGSTVTISATGVYEVTGTGEKTLVIDTGDDAMDVTLILNNADLSCADGPALQVKQAKHFRLQLAAGSENRLCSGTEDQLQNPDPNASGSALYSADDMDIEGEGSLKVYGYLNNGIGCKNDLDINSGSITVVAANNGVKGKQSVQIKGGSLAVTSWGDGIKSETVDKEGKGFVEISGGSVAVEAWGDGVQAATELRISGGNLSVTTHGEGTESSSKALKGETLVQISGGGISLDTREDGIRCVNGNVEISGGEIQILALADGIRAGEKESGLGDVLITDGSVAVSAGKRAVKARGGFSVTGGSLCALCASEKQDFPSGSPYLLCTLVGPEGDSVQVAELFSLSARLSYKTILVVSGELVSGQQIAVTNRQGTINAAVKG